MLQKPEKPKHYVRDQVIIGFIALVIMAVLLYFQTKHFYVVLVPLWFFIITATIWFRKYDAQKVQYQKQIISQNAQTKQSQQSATTSSVNENIAKYEKLQIEKRANAKWWQFWV